MRGNVQDGQSFIRPAKVTERGGLESESAKVQAIRVEGAIQIVEGGGVIRAPGGDFGEGEIGGAAPGLTPGCLGKSVFGDFGLVLRF